MVRSLALSFLGDARSPVSQRGLPSVRLVPAALRQRYPHLRKAGREEVGV